MRISDWSSDVCSSDLYDSVIGMDKTVPIERFVKKVKGERLSVAGGEGTLCAVFVETDDSTGFARRVAPVRLGGRLAEPVPDSDFRWGDGRRRWRGNARPPSSGSRSAGSSSRPAGGFPRGGRRWGRRTPAWTRGGPLA